MLPPQLPHHNIVASSSLVWSLFCLLAIWAEALENWAHRLSAFLGFLLCTIEGILGLLGFAGKPGLLLVATLHGATFILSVVGKYQSRVRSRPKRSMEQLAQAALEDIRSQNPAE